MSESASPDERAKAALAATRVNTGTVSSICQQGDHTETCGPPGEDGKPRAPCSLNAFCSLKSDDPEEQTNGRCQCNEGFVGNGYVCEPLNSCNDPDRPTKCHVNATCSLSEGWNETKLGMNYTCECNSGYIGDGETCMPHDRCADGSSKCDLASTSCVSTGPGSYDCQCRTDPDRFVPLNETHCKAFDWCTDTYWSNCDRNAKCSFIKGASSHSCSCNVGFEGDGLSCDMVDPCKQDAHICPANMVCKFEGPGNYSCACAEGFTKNDMGSCASINPCALNNVTCSQHAHCTHTGPAKAVCTCDTGYTGDGNTGCWDACTIMQKHCAHGSYLPHKRHIRSGALPCACAGCKLPWAGIQCDQCTLKASSCANGGQFHPLACLCHRCEGPYGGTTCEQWMSAGSKADDIEAKKTIIAEAVADNVRRGRLEAANETGLQLAERLIARIGHGRVPEDRLHSALTGILKDAVTDGMHINAPAPGHLLAPGQLKAVLDRMSQHLPEDGSKKKNKASIAASLNQLSTQADDA